MEKVICAFLLFTGLAANAQESSSAVSMHGDAPSIGRYQVVEVMLSNPPDAAEKQSKHMVLLDTATGVMSVCDYVYNNGGRDNKDGREYWGANGICAPFSTSKGWYIPKTSNASKAAKK